MNFDLADEIIFKEPRVSMNPRSSWLPLYRNVKRQCADKSVRNFQVRESWELQQY